MKKFFAMLLVLVMLLSVAACGNDTGEVTPTETPAATQTVQATIKPTATVKPTATATSDGDASTQATPTAAPDESEENLVPEKSATFETAKDGADTGWGLLPDSLDTGTITLVQEGIEGSKCIKYAPGEGNKETWYGPAINIRPFIKEAGEHEITFDFKSETPSPGWLIRGKSKDDENSFITQNQTNGLYYMITEPTMEMQGEEGWKTVTITVVIEEDDLQGSENHFWIFIPDHLNVLTDMVVYIDNFCIVNHG
jgi:predicted small lipoprotein YifL